MAGGASTPPPPTTPGFLGAEISPPTGAAARLGRGLPLRLDRPSAGLDQQRHPAGVCLAAGQRYLRRPGTQQVSAAARGHTDPAGDRRRDPPRRPGARRRLPRLAGPYAAGRRRVRRASAEPSCSARSRGSRTNGPRCTASTTPTDLDTWLTSTGAAGTPRRGRRSSTTSAPARSTTRSAAGSPSRSNGNQAPPPSETKTCHRGVGRPVPDRGAAHARAVAAEDAAVARPARRKPAVQLHHELRDDALLREPAAETLAAAAAGHASGSERTGEASASSPPSPRSGWQSSTW